MSSGHPAALPFDGMQREEVLLTVAQSLVAILLLVRMRFEWRAAVLLFVLRLAQFVVAEWRDEIIATCGVWAAVLLLSWIWSRPTAPAIFWHLVLGRREEAEALVE